MSECQSTNPIPESLRSDHLFLLVGKNPLPNAVSGKLLVSPTGKITLIHSEETDHVAMKLRDWLLKNVFCGASIPLSEERVFKCQVEEFNAADIYRKLIGVSAEEIKNAAINRVPGAQRIGLNYTGGTKAMAVHAYRALEKWKAGKSVTVKCSYLNADSLGMIFDPSDLSEGSEGNPIPVGLAVQLTLKKLLETHGWKLSGSQDKPILPLSSEEIAKYQSTQSANNCWEQWRKQQNGKDAWNLPCDTELQNIVENIRKELELNVSDNEFSDEMIKHKYSCRGKDANAWVKGGGWLESFVLKTLLDHKDELKLHECKINLYALSSQKSPGSSAATNFELDVAAVRGYQIFAFSCGITQDMQKLKSKLFEVYFRSRILGGDEARAALVCLWDDPHNLEEEIQGLIDMGAMAQAKKEKKEVKREERQIRVFGRKHLGKLSEHLTAWIKCQSGEKQ